MSMPVAPEGSAAVPRVLLVSYEYPPIGGGGGRAVARLWHEFEALGLSADVLTSQGAEPAREQRPHGTLLAVPTRRRSPHEAGGRAMGEFLWRAARHLRRALRQGDYALVHYFFSVPTGLLRFLVPRKTPYVVSLRGGDVPGYNVGEFETLHRLLWPLNRRVWAGAATVTAVSEHLAVAAQRLAPDLAVEVIRNGVDVHRFPPRTEPPARHGPVELLCVARLLALKGIQHLLVGLQGATDLDWRLTIIGTGPHEAALRRQVAAGGLAERVVFAGALPQEELPQRYRQADIFVLPSYGEACPNVVLEAMASGLPVVVTTASGAAEFVADGEEGCVVPPQDPAALVAALRRLAAMPGRGHHLGAAGARRVRQAHAPRGVAEQYLALYRRILQRDGG